MIRWHFFVVPFLFSKVALYDLTCPENLHRTHRLKSFCNTTLLTSYSCLLNEHTNAFEESCSQEANYVRPGQRYVINGFRTNTDCSELTYQPFKFWSHKYSKCIFSKSLCSEMGQIIYENTSTTKDNKCRCNHNDGYVFNVQPKHTCYCVPTEEDCTCIKKKCPSNYFLSSDYDCMSISTSSELSLCQEGDPSKNIRKKTIHKKLPKDTNDKGPTPYRRRNYTVFPFSLVIITGFVIMCLVEILIDFCRSAVTFMKDALLSDQRVNNDLTIFKLPSISKKHLEVTERRTGDTIEGFADMSMDRRQRDAFAAEMRCLMPNYIDIVYSQMVGNEDKSHFNFRDAKLINDSVKVMLHNKQTKSYGNSDEKLNRHTLGMTACAEYGGQKRGFDSLTGHIEKIEKLFEYSKKKENTINCLDRNVYGLQVKPQMQYDTISTSSSCIKVAWDRCKHNDLPKVHNYEIKYGISGMKYMRFEKLHVSLEEERKKEIHGLKCNTLYDIIVYLCDDEGGIHRIVRTTCKTRESCAQFIMDKLSPHRTMKPSIYRLEPVAIFPKDADINNDTKSCYDVSVRYYEMIEEYKPLLASDEKTLLIIGATCTGKSTFIDALFNYTADVSFCDDHRFALTNDTEESSITVYRIPQIKGFKLNSKLNIIDTPGSHMKQSSRNFENVFITQIRTMFETKLYHLDAVLVCVPFSFRRLREEKSVLFSILDMFDVHLSENVFVISTFYSEDTRGTQIYLELLHREKVPCSHVLYFDNAELLNEFRDNCFYPDLQKKNWRQRTKSFDELFAKLEMTRAATLKSSNDATCERTHLEV